MRYASYNILPFISKLYSLFIQRDTHLCFQYNQIGPQHTQLQRYGFPQAPMHDPMTLHHTIVYTAASCLHFVLHIMELLNVDFYVKFDSKFEVLSSNCRHNLPDRYKMSSLDCDQV